ncbi:cation:dicarboxylate symporter family transporter [Enterobacter hormaechei]
MGVILKPQVNHNLTKPVVFLSRDTDENLTLQKLYFQALTAIAIGILLGHHYPELGAQMKPLGDAFVKLIKTIIAPVIFWYRGDRYRWHGKHEGGRAYGAVALLYFEIVSTIALIIGLIIVNVVQPGAGMNVDPATLDAKAVAVYAEQAKIRDRRLPAGRDPEQRYWRVRQR